MSEESLKIFACDVIQNAGILLRLSQIAITTGQLLLQRVYYSPDFTFEQYPVDLTAMAALFLAAKVEEYPRKAREIIDVFTYVISHKLHCDIRLKYSAHEKVREQLINYERRILKNLGFNLLSNYPHKILLNYYLGMVRVLDPENNVWKDHINKRIMQKAWNYCNDSLRTDVFIRYSNETVICACIQLACIHREILMPFPKATDGREWYCLFANQHEVEAVIDAIEDLYDYERPSTRDLKPYIYLATQV